MSNTPITKKQASADHLRLQAIIAWTVTAIGTSAFHLLHVYSGVGQVVALSGGHDHDHGHDHGEAGGHLDFYASLAEHNSISSWQMVVFLALAVVPPVLGLVIASRAGAVSMLVVGTVYSALMVFDGFAHGFSEGAWPTLVLALVAVALPAVVAVIKNLELVRTIKTVTAR